MAYIVTRITEDRCAEFDRRQFDEVRLANMSGVLGIRVCGSPTSFGAQGPESEAKAEPRKRLVVQVDEDPASPRALQRVRAALRC